MTEAEEEYASSMMVRGLANQVSIEEIMQFDLSDELRQALLVWKLYDTIPVGKA